MKFISLACLLTLFLAAAPARAADNVLPPPAGDAFIYFTSDQASAEPDNKKITLQGNVTVIQKTKDGKTRTVTGENISLDQTNTQISSVGPMTVKDGQGNVLTGNNVSVNYTTKDFKAEDISTEYPPLRVLSAKEISSISQKETLRNATLTCCDNPDPHYTLSVGKLTVSPKKRVFGTNAVLRLDGFPIFYLPLFWRSLQSQKPWTTYVDFTQSNKTGFGILTSTVFNPVFNLRPKLNLDYYTNSGLGLGGGLTAVESPTCRAVIGGKCTTRRTISTTPTVPSTNFRPNSVWCPTRTFTTPSSAATRISLCRTRKQTSLFPAKRAVPRCA